MELREYPIPEDVNVYIFVAHTTNASDEEVEIAFKNADVITACASDKIRDYAEKEEVYYSGSKVPLFAVTEKGREFLDNRLEKIGKALTAKDYPLTHSNLGLIFPDSTSRPFGLRGLRFPERAKPDKKRLNPKARVRGAQRRRVLHALICRIRF